MRTLLALLLCAGAGACACAAAKPAAPAAPVADTAPPHETFTLPSAALGETRRINVYVPPGSATGGERHPILYMPDGGVAEDFPHVTRTVDRAIRAGEMRPVIVVGIENTERRRDLTGPTENAEDRKIAPRVGGSAAFRAFLRDELMPAIDRRWRGNGETGIIGESLAALFIVETLLVEPAMFDVHVALSPNAPMSGESHATIYRAASPIALRKVYPPR